VLFIVSIALALLLAPFESFHSDESPFVTALKDLRFHSVVHIFNGVLILAGFSSLVASLYSVTQMVYTIAKDGDAPKFLTKESKRKIPYRALCVTVGGMALSIVTALLLPKQVYEYITTAGGLMLLYTWLMMVLSARKLLKLTMWGHIKSITAIVLILAAASGTLFDSASRPGFYASAAFVVIIGAVTLIMRKHWKKEGETGGGGNNGGGGLETDSNAGGNEEGSAGGEPDMWMPRKERASWPSKEKAR
jgi:L-asparagine transporter-like permease